MELFEKIQGTNLRINITWDREHGGVRAQIVPGPVEPQGVWDRSVLNRPLTVEQAAVAMTSRADVYKPDGDAVVVLAVMSRDDTSDGWWAHIGDGPHEYDMPLRRLSPSRGLLAVIQERYGRNVDLSEPYRSANDGR